MRASKYVDDMKQYGNHWDAYATKWKRRQRGAGSEEGDAYGS